MKWKDVVYQYDGSFEGLLCCIFESYTQKERPTSIVCEEDAEWCLYETRTVVTDRAHAERVCRSLRKLSPRVAPFLYRAFLTCLPEREAAIYRFVAKLYREGAPYLLRLNDEAYAPLRKAVRRLLVEAERLRGFVRFSDYGGTLGAVIEPDNRVLPLLRGHFCERCHDETFFLYDRTHREALLYADGRSHILPLESYDPAPPDAEEAAYRRLWKLFYDAVAIRERENPKKRLKDMPRRYWAQMTEMKEPPPAAERAGKFSAPPPLTPSPRAAAPAPCAPNATPAPAIRPARAPRAPASAP